MAAPREHRDKKWVLEQVKKDNVRFIKVWFTDILGSLKSFTIPVSELETAFEEGVGFDGSSVEGFTRIDESDMLAWPDPDTYCVLPGEVLLLLTSRYSGSCFDSRTQSPAVVLTVERTSYSPTPCEQLTEDSRR